MNRFLSIVVGVWVFQSISAQVPEIDRAFVRVKGDTDTIPVVTFGDELDSDTMIEEIMVTEIKDFYLSKTCVSVQDYKTYCAETAKPMPAPPAWGWGDGKKPMVNISYINALEYCSWLSDKYQMRITLPHESQWKYAANNGRFIQPYQYEEVIPDAEVYAVYHKNKPDCITCKQPNRLGLYDMVGNVWEWVDGWFFNLGDTPEDTVDEKRMIIGGSYLSSKDDMQLEKAKMVSENSKVEDVGFRLYISAEDYENAQELRKRSMQLKELFNGNPPIMLTVKGIVSENTTMLWDDVTDITLDTLANEVAITGHIYTVLGLAPHTFRFAAGVYVDGKQRFLPADFLKDFERFKIKQED